MSDLFNNWIYETNEDNSARFVLGEKSDNPLICIGVNPSTATPEKLDPTLRRVKKFSQTLGFDGWILLNLYPQRATNPDQLHKEKNIMLHLASEDAIEKHIDGLKTGLTIWAAWGCLINKRPYLFEFLEYFAEYFAGDHWVTLGETTKDGHPRHPLYLPGKTKMQEFDIKGYLKKLKAR